MDDWSIIHFKLFIIHSFYPNLPNTNMKDEMKYINALQNNDKATIREIYKKCFPIIRSHIIKNSGTHDDAWDMFQEGLIIVLKKSNQPDFKLTASFCSYLFSICHYRWSNELRKKRSSEVTLSDDITLIEEASIEKLLHNEAQMKLYKEKLGELGERCQKILFLYFKKVKFKIIAEKMGFKNEKVARKQKHVCQKKLIQKIMEDSRYSDLKFEG